MLSMCTLPHVFTLIGFCTCDVCHILSCRHPWVENSSKIGGHSHSGCAAPKWNSLTCSLWVWYWIPFPPDVVVLVLDLYPTPTYIPVSWLISLKWLMEGLEVCWLLPRWYLLVLVASSTWSNLQSQFYPPKINWLQGILWVGPGVARFWHQTHKYLP